jgi:alpha-glucosidase
MIDFSNPDAKKWAKNIIKNNMLKEASAVGWMADFAEYTPTDVVCQNAEAYAYHNRYPYEWAKLNQEAIEEAGMTDEIVYFMRAGSTHSPAVTSLYWMGD